LIYFREPILLYNLNVNKKVKKPIFLFVKTILLIIFSFKFFQVCMPKKKRLWMGGRKIRERETFSIQIVKENKISKLTPTKIKFFF